jgi:hypothetical protein
MTRTEEEMMRYAVKRFGETRAGQFGRTRVDPPALSRR